MKNKIIKIFLILITFISLFFYIKNHSISKRNLDLVVLTRSSQIKSEYYKELYSLDNLRNINQRYIQMSEIVDKYELEYGKEFCELEKIIEKSITSNYHIVYNSESFLLILFISLLFFWIGISIFIYWS